MGFVQHLILPACSRYPSFFLKLSARPFAISLAAEGFSAIHEYSFCHTLLSFFLMKFIKHIFTICHSSIMVAPPAFLYPLYLTSFVLRDFFAQLRLIQIKGAVEVDQAFLLSGVIYTLIFFSRRYIFANSSLLSDLHSGQTQNSRRQPLVYFLLSSISLYASPTSSPHKSHKALQRLHP